MNRLKRIGGEIQQIPNGIYYRESSIRWDSRKVLGTHPSFKTLVGAVISARRAHPHQMAENNWSLDPDVVAGEVEAFLVKICLSMGWTQYLAESGGSAPAAPFIQTNPQEQKLLLAAATKAKKLWSGLKTLNEWLESNEPAVSSDQSEKRASICVACPFNGKGDLTSFFTSPAAAAIRRQLERVQQRNFKTSLDDQLGVCAEKDGNGGCLCVNKLSVHVPLKIKLAHMAPDTKASLHPSCWLLAEEKELTESAKA